MQIDTTQFPFIFLREHDHDHPHTAGADEQVLLALLEGGEHFVLLTDQIPGDHDHPEESHEDRKQRTLFFKQNKARIREVCRGMIVITGESAVPMALRLGLQGIGKAFGVPAAFVKSEHDAREQAERWLGA